TAAISNNIGIDIATAGADGNRICTNADATSDSLERNHIAGNTNGILRIVSSSNVIAGNYIGTDINGTSALGGVGISLEVSATNNLIGSNGDGVNDATERNLISGNSSYGVQLTGSGTSGNTVAGNWIGLKSDGATALPNTGGLEGATGVYINSGA